MSNIREQFDHSAFAQAAYSTLTPPVNGTSYVNALTDGDGANMAAVQAEEFADAFEVVDHQLNTEEGFSATVFRSKVDGQFARETIARSRALSIGATRTSPGLAATASRWGKPRSVQLFSGLNARQGEAFYRFGTGLALVSLEELGVTSFDLGSATVNEAEAQGHLKTGTGCGQCSLQIDGVIRLGEQAAQMRPIGEKKQ